jgi:AraC-like DNA-binding protein
MVCPSGGMVDAADSKSASCKGVGVQVPPGAPSSVGTSKTMYTPVKDGIEKALKSVIYSETKPPDNLSGLVHCFWELKTEAPLHDDFLYHILPDACVNILFNQIDIKIAAITALHTTSKILNLGKTFHYVGIQLLPGVWRGNPEEIIKGLVDQPYADSLPLIQTNRELANVDYSTKHTILSKLIEQFMSKGFVQANPITATILTHIDDIQSVADMANITGISSRQLQRILKKTTGFSPHDFLKVLRIQHSFKQEYACHYTDQSHFIHSFRKITGYTPTKYSKKFDV